MSTPSFRVPLPEDRLSEKERNERIRILDRFAKKLKKDRKGVSFDDKNAIRQLLHYAGKRLELLDLEDRHARGLAKYDSLLGSGAKPVPQSLFGVAADALRRRLLRGREKMIRRHEEATKPLIKEISLMASDINGLLDERPLTAPDLDGLDKRLSLDEANHVLRPISCLPEVAVNDEDAPSESENAADHVSKPKVTRKPGAWLDPGNTKIFVDGETYWRNRLADKISQMKGLTDRQRDAAILSCGYQSGKVPRSKMSDATIAALMGCKRKTVYDHRSGAISKMRKDSEMRQLLDSLKPKIGDKED